MAISAQSIIQRAHVALQDEGVRWPASELVRHLNDGQREISRVRPDQTAVNQLMPLVDGYFQTLLPTHQALIDMHNNAASPSKRITKVDMVVLDAVEPGWRAKTKTAEVKHFMHDLREPRYFYVYPPAIAGTAVNIVVSTYPAEIPFPTAPGIMFQTVTGDISLPDHWADALLNFVLHRAYAKDAEYGGNANMSTMYLNYYNAAVGTQLQSTSTVSPKS